MEQPPVHVDIKMPSHRRLSEHVYVAMTRLRLEVSEAL